MTILHFAEHQNDVFLPALLALLVAAVAAAVPVVFAPTLKRTRRLKPIVAIGVVIAAGAVVVGAWQAGTGFRALADERGRVRSELAARYDVSLDPGQVGELIDGGKPKVVLRSQGEALGLQYPSRQHALQLVATSSGSDVYDLRFAGRVLPPT